jgi:hypothetical protein
LGTLFTLFSALRVVAYLPTLWAIHASGNASQYSLWTWFVFCGANLSTAFWLNDRCQGGWDRNVVVSAVNALMCAAVFAVILGHRS